MEENLDKVENNIISKLHGGKREGSGRKASIDKINNAKKKLAWNEFKVELAESGWEEATKLMRDEDPKVRMDIIKTAWAYAYGKPKETHLLGNDEGKPFEINSVDKTTAQRIAVEYEEKMREAILESNE